MTTPNTYECSFCHGTFERGWSEEEALAEMREGYGELPAEERAIVCEDCFQEILVRERHTVGDA